MAKRTFKVFVGIDEADGRPLPWTAAFFRKDCRRYIHDWIGDVSEARAEAADAIRALTTPDTGTGE